MQRHLIRRHLLALYAALPGLLLAGCDNQNNTPSPANTSNQKPSDQLLILEMVLETSETTFRLDGEQRDVVQWLSALAMEKIDEEAAYTLGIDHLHERDNQLKLVMQPLPGQVKDVDLHAEADEFFESLRQSFDTVARQALEEELAFERLRVREIGLEVESFQKALQAFQETHRGLPQTDASKLERRKLERQIELALQAQIEAGKRVEQLQKRIDREQYATLMRVR